MLDWFNGALRLNEAESYTALGQGVLTVLCFVASVFGGDLYVCQRHRLCKVFLGFTVIKKCQENYALK